MTTSTHDAQVRTGGPVMPARPVVLPVKMARSRKWVDSGARWFVSLGGVLIILCIMAILVVILAEVYPLLLPPRAALHRTFESKSGVANLAVGIDEHWDTGWMVTARNVQLVSWRDNRILETLDIPALKQAETRTACVVSEKLIVLGLSDGRILPIEVGFNTEYTTDEQQGLTQRRMTPIGKSGEPLKVGKEARPLDVLAYRPHEKGTAIAAATGPSELALLNVTEKKTLMGGVTRKVKTASHDLSKFGAISGLLFDEHGETLYIGTSSGRLIRWGVEDIEAPELQGEIQATTAGITAMGFINGQRTLVLGDERGAVSTWQFVREQGREVFAVKKLYDFQPHEAAVKAVTANQRNRGFATLDAAGVIKVHYATTGQTQLTIAGHEGLRSLAFTPKGNGLVGGDASGNAKLFEVHNPHPESATWSSLFGKLWYEGYEKPEYVWQSTGGTDDFESKLSLTPLVIGTLKGTLFAMLFAIPIATLSALYASQFMHPKLKSLVKPTVEVMAALPSVVLGFIAGLWLAPVVERILPSIAMAACIVPVLILVALLLWRLIPIRIRTRVKPGTEVFLLVPVILAGGLLALVFGGVIETGLLGGDYRLWLKNTFQIVYDQRNSIVVGFAMGFAVIPIIFTIADDSLSNVPPHLVAGSLALGATRWQTAVRVVLPTASPGIFSAIMIGFGRAVGETMIVLMATGNTPITDWSPFNGFRALSANIAVELPEAHEGGTLYRVLFLAALLLFVMTFVVNTLAEVVRLRLRKRYRAI